MEKPLVLSQGWDAFFKFPISPKGSGKAAWEKRRRAGKKIQLARHIRRFLILGVNQQLKKKKSRTFSKARLEFAPPLPTGNCLRSVDVGSGIFSNPERMYVSGLCAMTTPFCMRDWNIHGGSWNRRRPHRFRPSGMTV